jgi:PilZ domain-containing protein
MTVLSAPAQETNSLLSLQPEETQTYIALNSTQAKWAVALLQAAAQMMIDDSYKQPDSSASPPGEDGLQRAKQRSVLRCALVASAEVIELASRAQLKARTSELGLGGCYIDTLNPFPQGTLVQLRILRDNGLFETQAKVVYSDVRFGMGLAFTEMTGEQRSLLESWLVELVTKLKPTS